MLKPIPALSRRVMLRWTSQALLAAGFWPGVRMQAAGSSSNFEFLILNDLHHVAPECTTWLNRVVHQLQTHTSAEFALILGDLTDLGTESSHRAVREVFEGFGKPYYVQIGNHDYLSPTDRSFYTATHPDRLNYFFRHRGWQFIGVDTTEGQKYEKTSIQPTTLEWLDKNLRRLRRSRPTVLFTHFPLAQGVNYCPTNANALLDKFRDFNLKAVFSGHYHALTLREDAKGVPFATNRCCARIRGNHDGSKEKGYFLCSARKGELQHRFVEVNA
jgi:3',5'-cyclic AMP phosphodiesterase CpdA